MPWSTRCIITVCLVVLLTSTVWLQGYNKTTFLQLHTDVRKEDAHLLPVPLLRVLSLGYEGFMADIQWLQLVQHIGKTVLSRGYEDDLAPYIARITALDPQFADAYTVGMLLLHQSDPRQALAIGAQGITALCDPDAIQEVMDFSFATPPVFSHKDMCNGHAYLLSLLGLLTYEHTGDAYLAARYYTIMAHTEGGEHMGTRFTALMLSNAQERTTALLLWKQLAEEAPSELLQEYAIQRALREHHLIQLETAYQTYIEQYGKIPSSPDVLASSGVVDANILIDPMNTTERTYEYRFDDQGKAHVHIIR